MSWLRLDESYASDGRIRKARAVAWWPLILAAMKRGDGVATDDDIDPFILAELGQGDEAGAARAVAGLKACGLLVPVDGGWSTPDVERIMPDPTGAARARQYREKRKAERHSDVTVRHSDVTVTDVTRNGPSRETYRHTDVQTGQPRAEVVVTTSRATPPPPEPQPTTDSAAACELMRQATGVMFLPPMQVHQVGQLVAEVGAQAVEEAIREASASNTRGKPSIRFVETIARRIASGAPRPAPAERVAGPPRHFGSTTVMPEWDVPRLLAEEDARAEEEARRCKA